MHFDIITMNIIFICKLSLPHIISVTMFNSQPVKITKFPYATFEMTNN